MEPKLTARRQDNEDTRARGGMVRLRIVSDSHGQQEPARPLRQRPARTLRRGGADRHGDPDRVRSRVLRLIAEARAAETMPWDDDDLRRFRKIVPQMVHWRPEEEGRQLCFDFEEEIRRLQAA